VHEILKCVKKTEDKVGYHEISKIVQLLGSPSQVLVSRVLRLLTLPGLPPLDPVANCPHNPIIRPPLFTIWSRR